MIQLDSIEPQCLAVCMSHRKFSRGDSVGDRCQRWRGWLRPVAQCSRHGSVGPSSDKSSIVGMYTQYCICQCTSRPGLLTWPQLSRLAPAPLKSEVTLCGKGRILIMFTRCSPKLRRWALQQLHRAGRWLTSGTRAYVQGCQSARGGNTGKTLIRCASGFVAFVPALNKNCSTSSAKSLLGNRSRCNSRGR